MRNLRGQRVNYDRIAHLYDEPLREHSLDPNLVQYMSERPDLQATRMRILDMGCGTGSQLSADRREFPTPLMVGLDLFLGMLRQAQKRAPGLAWVQGDSARAPFQDDCFDYITNQFSYPHVQGKAGMVAEIYRILKPGGRFVMTHIDPWSMTDWIVYRYFPAARKRDFEDFWPVEEFKERLEAAGFKHIQASREYQSKKENLKEFREYAWQRYRTSQLMVLSEEDYQAGLAKIEEGLAKGGQDRTADSELCLVTIRGDKEK